LYSSALRRARETAAAIGAALALEPRIEPDLREMDHGDWEGLTKEEILARWPAEFAAFETDPVRVRRPGGDSYGDLAARLCPVLDALAARHRGERIVIVSHGGPIRLMLSRILEIPLTERERLGVTNARWFPVEWEDGVWRMAPGD
ncbi:MAG: histidine phosphatase family protein, partial [Gemmatimonadota bacterium]